MPKTDTPNTSDSDLPSEQIRESASGPVSEGELHAIRDALKLERVAGHSGTLIEWEESEEGQRFLNEEAPKRAKQVEEENKAVAEQSEDSEKALESYKKAVQSARKTTEKAAEETRRSQDKQNNRDNK